jgi:Na+/H+ antiporter NhaD/arsenite permease-like protein
MTVIGDPTGLVLWNRGLITATGYSMSMALPCLLAWIIPTALVSMRLPEKIEIEHPRMPYRGDDTNMRFWQRGIMFIVAIGGLWFIPSFTSITKLPPFLGAFCVLSLLWIVNEIFNHTLFSITRRFRIDDTPQRMLYNTVQQILYIVGVILAVGVVIETGAMSWFSEHIDSIIGNIWIIGAITGLISTVLDSFASCITMVSLHDVSTVDAYYTVDGAYWKVLSFTTSVGGSILAFGSISGVVFMQRQGVSLSWYFMHVTPLALTGGIIGFIVLCLELI